MLAGMLDDAERDDLLALLAWWRAAGVDVALEAAPIDWTARSDAGPGVGFQWPERGSDAIAVSTAPAVNAAAPVTPSPPRTVPPVRAPLTPSPAPAATPRPLLAREAASVPISSPRTFTATPPDTATIAAREAARKAPTLEALEASLRGFDGCGLKATAKNLCFYRGSPTARLMVIGEAPGNEDDRAGKPFVGPSGQLLDRMLAAIGLGEADVHITNTVYWRPPGNRPLTLQETLVCRPFLERQIELVRPTAILTLGGPATKAMIEGAESIMRIRGRWHQVTIGGAQMRVMPTLHPDYLLQTPAAKRQAWRDLLAIKAALATA